LFTVIALVVMFLFGTVYLQSWIIDRMVFSQVNTLTSNFSDTVRTKGYISRKDYDDFTKLLSITNRAYDVKISHREVKYYPLEVSDSRYTPEKPYIVLYFKHDEREIFNTLYKLDQNYNMLKGDDVKIEVKPIGNVKKGIEVFGMRTIIYANYGGMVNNQ
jgi:hypothetical protein